MPTHAYNANFYFKTYYEAKIFSEKRNTSIANSIILEYVFQVISTLKLGKESFFIPHLSCLLQIA